MAALASRGIGPGAVWKLTWVRQSCDVWAVAEPGSAAPTAFVKHGHGPEVLGLQGETQRLRWLGARLAAHRSLAVANVLVAADLGGSYVLATTALDGLGSQEGWAAELPPARLAALLGRTLATFHHALEPADCPWSVPASAIVMAARARLAAGGLAADQLPQPFTGAAPARAVDWLADHAPEAPDGSGAVVTHGDAGLPNLLVPEDLDGPIGIIDVGRLGVSDPYRDLSVLVRSFVANCGPDHQETLTQAYGLDRLDHRRLDWWRIGDDLW